MTFRAIFIGMLLGAAIAAFGYFNDWIMQQAFLATNLIPICVYGLLLIGLLLVNPLLRAIRLKGLSVREWCVVVALMLVASVVPGPGLMWYFSNTLTTPFHEYAQQPGWRKHDLLNYVPDVMLVDPGPIRPGAKAGADYAEVIRNFRTGLPNTPMRLSNVPWHAWRKTLTFWIPLIGLSFIAGICLVFVVHQQWSKRERLRYPIAYVTAEIVDGWAPADKGEGGIFRNKNFWLGFSIPAVILLINGYQTWNSQSIQIAMNVPGLASSFGNKWPSLWRIPSSWLLLNPTLYFSAVGFAYFVGSDISFSLGISAVVYGAAFLVAGVAGLDVSGGGLSGGLHTFQMFGSYLGIAMVILYTGRNFYKNVLAGALFIPMKDRIDRGTIRAFQIAVLAAAAMVAMLILALRMDWLLAILFVLLVGMMFLVVTRINVETGLFMIQPGWYAVSVLLALFGFGAIGPHMLMILGILCMVLTVDPIVCLMPLAANAMKLGETKGLRLGKLSRWMIVSVLVALLAGVVGTLVVQYTHGGTKYGWADVTAKMPFDLVSRKIQAFTGDPSIRHGLELANISPNVHLLYAIGAGIAVVLVLSTLRLRYTWWPLHPVLFLIWGTFPGMVLAPSFLFGWLIKTVVTALGGGRAYRHSKPFFVGLIAGEFAAAIFWTIVGAAYYMITGIPGPAFRILPA